jgi:hypothetical protein
MGNWISPELCWFPGDVAVLEQPPADFDRVGSLYKKGTPQRELPDVNEVVRETLALLRSEADRYSLSIRADLA